MIGSWTVLALSLGYVAFLFAIAHLGDRAAKRRGRRPKAKPIIYALSLAVYCTSWTFYGSVGLAARTGYDFLPIYIGPILLFALGWPLLTRIIRISKAHNITSIADFIAARYGKSQALAAVVTIVAVIGALPYIALQLKAVSASFLALTRAGMVAAGAHGEPIWSDTALAVSLILALFAILFGTRHVDATDHHEGMILAIAFESVVKLLSFLMVGAFVTWGIFGGLADLASRAGKMPAITDLFTSGVDGSTWVTMTGLAFAAALCLPRQFHVAVVENADVADMRKAAWLFPLYLVAINLFVIPICIAGLLVFPTGNVDGDLFVLALPIAEGNSGVALLAFIGGFSAATGMVIVACIATSTMVSNDLVMPILLRGGRLGLAQHADIGAIVLHIRRISILAFMLLAYCFYRLIGDSVALASIGLLSFAAMAQFAPALLGGLVWRGATAKGAIAGIVAGFTLWVYTLLLPALAASGWLSQDLLEHGPFGVWLLRPEALLGLRFSPLTHGVFWSLLANITCYCLVSLARLPRVVERNQASAFIDFSPGQGHPGGRAWHGSIRVSELADVAARYLGVERAQRSFAEFARRRSATLDPAAPAEFGLVRHTERMLAGAIGAPSARLVIALSLERRNLSLGAAMRLLDDATAAIQYNRDLLQATLENVRQGISVFDRDLRLICWNRRFRDLLDLPAEFGRVGVGLEEIIRFNAERGEYGPGDADSLVQQRLQLFIGRGETVFERRRPNGTVLEMRNSPMAGGYVTTYSDITEHVRAAGELAVANERLEERVRERTAALTALNDALRRAKAIAEDADLGKTRFLAAASHDLLQPLSAARLYVSTLLERQERQPAEDILLVRKVDASLRLVEDLLGTLLDISRLDAGALKPDRGDFTLDELFGSLRMEFAPLAERKGLDLRVMRSSLSVESDRHMLHRVLQNLLSNALRYTTTGRVLMGARRAGGDVVIQVCDTGAGIAPEHQAHVFREFHRYAAGPGSEQGLGLGLSIVERICRILDHPVGLRSQPGRGTVFSVRVPRGTPAEHLPPSEAVPMRAGPNLEQAVVLCIDNERSVLDGMRTLLESWSCRVLLAGDVAEALAALDADAGPPELLIVDYHLDHGGNGIEAVETLRRAYGADLPAVIITADRSEAVRARALAHGVALLNKPVRPAALRALLMRLLLAREAAE